MKKFMVYIDDGRNAMRIAVPAENAKAAKKYAEGNGEIVAVRDITEDYPIDINKVVKALEVAGFGEIERDLVMRTLLINRIAE